MNKMMSKKRGHSHGHCVIGRMRISPASLFRFFRLHLVGRPTSQSLTYFGGPTRHRAASGAIPERRLAPERRSQAQ